MGISLKRMEQLILSMLKITRLDTGNIIFEKKSCRVSELIAHSVNDLTTRAKSESKQIQIDGDGEQQLIENVIMMVPFTSMVIWTFQEKMGSSWKKILWYSGKIAFIFSISIEVLQLFLRLGTFQLSDLFYNTVGGMIGGLMYYGITKAKKHL